MKRLSLFSFLAIFALGMIMTSCTEDPGTGGGDPGGGGGGGGLEDGPTVSLVDEAGFVSSDITIGPNTEFTVRLSAVPGDATLNSFFLEEDGLNLDAARFAVDGVPAAANPLLIFSPDTEGLTWDITIRSQAGANTTTYSFVIVDENSNSGFTSIDVTTEADAGDPPFIDVPISGMFDVEAESLVRIPLVAAAGSWLLSSVAVYEDDVLVDPSRCFYDEITNPFDVNPYLIPEEDKNGLDRDIWVRASSEPGTKSYRLVVSDEFGTSVTTEWTITTAPLGTPVTSLTGTLLLNAGGPAGTGGLDLDDGIGTGSSDAIAEIKDEGIDLGLPAADNWKQVISGANGTDLRSLFIGQNGLSESFSFTGVESKEQITELWNNSIEFGNGVNEDGERVSWPVEIGDIFIALNGGQYYILEVTDVQITTGDGDNDDFYQFDIKY